MTGRRGRSPAASAKTTPALHLPAKRPLKTIALSGAIVPHHHNTNDFGELKNNLATRLQTLKKDMDHEHASKMKQIDLNCGKLKKRLKHETQALNTISEAIDTDWRNFLADYEEDTRENQTWTAELLTCKLEASATHFTKIGIPELLKTVEMSMDNIKNRYIRSAKSTRRLSIRQKANAKLTEISAD